MILLPIVSFWWPAYIAAFHPETGSAVAAKESGHGLATCKAAVVLLAIPAEAGIWALLGSLFITSITSVKEIRNLNIFRLSVIWTRCFDFAFVDSRKKTRYLLPMLIPGAINIAFYLWYSIKMLMA